MEAIPRHRFRILTLGREPLADQMATEVEWYRDPHEVVIGTVYRDETDDDWGYIVLGRDGRGQFRWIDGGGSDKTTDAARERLWGAMRAALVSGEVTFPQGDEAGRKLHRLMNSVHPSERLHPAFRQLSQNPGFSPAASLISEIAYAFTDPDGNFIEQFQTTGFDARLWELYLFVTLREQGCRFDRTKPAPDFVCDHFGLQFAVEAVTMNPSQTGADPPPPENPIQLRHYNEHFTPIRFGSALVSKLRKEYWKLSHVAGKPLVLAIQDFHQPRSMMWTYSGLPTYLYGYRYEPNRDERGNLVIKPIKIDRHIWGARSVPSGFFSLSGAEHISAVMFSNSGTISKFNRIGKLARFGDPSIRMIRTGEAVNLDQNAQQGVPFRREVNDAYQENWSEGLAMFHNPHALCPLPLEHFPGLVHHRLQGELIEAFSNHPFHPLWSFTEIIRP